MSENPVAFVRAVKQVLAPGGVWVFEMSYMPSMLQMNSYDTICHEHLEYYSLSVLEYILRAGGMKVINAVLNDINGGSIRCYATHIDSFIYKSEAYIRNVQTLRQRSSTSSWTRTSPTRTSRTESTFIATT